MEYAYDLHIHSALSPCADKGMTPNNIVNMALLKGLDIISLTDHNSGANLEAVGSCAEKKGLLFIPGMEIETVEEVHLVCLFPDVKKAMKLHHHVAGALPPILNRKDIFGSQLIMDENDNITGEEEQILVTAASLTIDDVFAFVLSLGGVVIPAHVDRSSYSILSNLGLIPDHLGITTLEISRNLDIAEYKALKPELEGYRLIRSSDAHRLGELLEKESFLDLKRLSVHDVLEALR